jgi:hypothetical protein
MEQLDLFPEEPKKEKPVDQEKVDKARARKAETEEFKDKRTPRSPLIQQAEMEKIREILKPKSSGGGGGGIPKSGKHEMLKFKSGGKVSSASKRADGIAIRGKTRA